jgi:hypothetical protein
VDSLDDPSWEIPLGLSLWDGRLVDGRALALGAGGRR